MQLGGESGFHLPLSTRSPPGFVIGALMYLFLIFSLPEPEPEPDPGPVLLCLKG